MQYSLTAAAVLAFASSVFAQTANFAPMTVPTQNQNVAAGSTLDITWQPSTQYTGSITIDLLRGSSPSTLEAGQVIAAGIDQNAGSYEWTVPTDIQFFETYGFTITLDSTAGSASPVFQYSFPFHITGLQGDSPPAPSPPAAAEHPLPGTGYAAVPMPTAPVHSPEPVPYVPSVPVNDPPTNASYPSYPAGNGTYSTNPTPSGGSRNTTGVPPPVTTGAASNIARGGFAVAAGMVLAFVL